MRPICCWKGRDPYSESSLLSLCSASLFTRIGQHLARGQIAGRLDYPGKAEIQAAFEQDIHNGSTGEFEDKVSYPALSFLPLYLLHSAY